MSTATLSTAARPNLSYPFVEAAIADVDRLRRGGYRKGGNWTLPQISFHVARLMETFLNAPPTDATATPEQLSRLEGFIAKVSLPGGPSQFQAPPFLIPPDSAGDADIDHLIAMLERLKAYPRDRVDAGPFGPVPIATFRALQLGHAAHHLSFLDPKLKRRESLRFKNIDDAIGELKTLRSTPHERVGNWSLNRIAWHLKTTALNTMKPATASPTPQQQAMRPALESLLATGALPHGLQAPDRVVPPMDVSYAEIDALIDILERAKEYDQSTADHFRFGPITADEFRQLVLAHSAHHLSHLVPNDA